MRAEEKRHGFWIRFNTFDTVNELHVTIQDVAHGEVHYRFCGPSTPVIRYNVILLGEFIMFLEQEELQKLMK
jgi:hypothetical protein